MKKFVMALLSVMLLPALVVAAELKGTVEKLDKVKSQLVLNFTPQKSVAL